MKSSKSNCVLVSSLGRFWLDFGNVLGTKTDQMPIEIPSNNDLEQMPPQIPKGGNSEAVRNSVEYTFVLDLLQTMAHIKTPWPLQLKIDQHLDAFLEGFRLRIWTVFGANMGPSLHQLRCQNGLNFRKPVLRYK